MMGFRSLARGAARVSRVTATSSTSAAPGSAKPIGLVNKLSAVGGLRSLSSVPPRLNTVTPVEPEWVLEKKEVTSRASNVAASTPTEISEEITEAYSSYSQDTADVSPTVAAARKVAVVTPEQWWGGDERIAGERGEVVERVVKNLVLLSKGNLTPQKTISLLSSIRREFKRPGCGALAQMTSRELFGISKTLRHLEKSADFSQKELFTSSHYGLLELGVRLFPGHRGVVHSYLRACNSHKDFSHASDAFLNCMKLQNRVRKADMEVETPLTPHQLVNFERVSQVDVPVLEQYMLVLANSRDKAQAHDLWMRIGKGQTEGSQVIGLLNRVYTSTCVRDPEFMAEGLNMFKGEFDGWVRKDAAVEREAARQATSGGATAVSFYRVPYLFSRALQSMNTCYLSRVGNSLRGRVAPEEVKKEGNGKGPRRSHDRAHLHTGTSFPKGRLGDSDNSPLLRVLNATVDLESQGSKNNLNTSDPEAVRAHLLAAADLEGEGGGVAPEYQGAVELTALYLSRGIEVTHEAMRALMYVESFLSGTNGEPESQRWMRCRHLISRLEDFGLLYSPETLREISMIAAQSGDTEAGAIAMERMSSAGFPIDSQLFDSLIRSHAEVSDAKGAVALTKSAIAYGMKPSPNTFGSLFKSCLPPSKDSSRWALSDISGRVGVSGLWKEVETLRVESGTPHTDASLLALCRVLAEDRKPALALRILSKQRAEERKDLRVLRAVADGGRGGGVEVSEAVKALSLNPELMREKQFIHSLGLAQRRTAVLGAYHSILDALAVDQTDDAMVSYGNLVRVLEQDPAYTLYGSSSSSPLEFVHPLYGNRSEAQKASKLRTLNAQVDFWSRRGDSDKCWELVSEVPESCSDINTCNLLLRAEMLGCEYGAVDRAIALLREMPDRGVVATPKTFLTAANVVARALGRPLFFSAQSREQHQKAGAVRDPGSSEAVKVALSKEEDQTSVTSTRSVSVLAATKDFVGSCPGLEFMSMDPEQVEAAESRVYYGATVEEDSSLDPNSGIQALDAILKERLEVLGDSVYEPTEVNAYTQAFAEARDFSRAIKLLEDTQELHVRQNVPFPSHVAYKQLMVRAEAFEDIASMELVMASAGKDPFILETHPGDAPKWLRDGPEKVVEIKKRWESDRIGKFVDEAARKGVTFESQADELRA